MWPLDKYSTYWKTSVRKSTVGDVAQIMEVSYDDLKVRKHVSLFKEGIIAITMHESVGRSQKFVESGNSRRPPLSRSK